MENDLEAEALDAICDALDRRDPLTAWEIARRALRRTEQDPVLRFRSGQALLELDRPAEAVLELAKASALDPEDAEYRVYHALSLFRACRFDDARREIEQAAASASDLPELRYVRGLCLERAGELQRADEEFRFAARLDADGFPFPSRFSEAEFERQLLAARNALNPDFRQHLDTVAVIVEPLPTDALLLEEEPALDPEHLLGLFTGVALDRQSSFSAGGELPPRIYLFKRNLERFTANGEELAEQIRITLYHELGHYLGMTEEDLERSGYA